MAQRRVIIPEIGEVVLAKRRGSTHIRLSINSKGQVRLGMPYWTPYEAGLMFIRDKKPWIQKQLQEYQSFELKNGHRIGKAHQLIFHNSVAKNGIAAMRITPTTIEVRTNLAINDPRVQEKAVEASEKALEKEAKQLLPFRVEALSKQYGLSYNSLKIRKLTSRWGSCSNKRDITLSYFLIQLPWELIDYVILHELAHTLYLNHSQEFWQFMEQRNPNLRKLRAQIKEHRPNILPR